jgi:Flp pilus assembly protein TadG
MTMIRNLRRDEDGAGAVEFALVAPALLGFIIGLTQLGMLFFANADLHNAVAAGARAAVVFPRPSDSTITGKITSMLAKLDQTKLSTPTIAHGTDGNGNDYEDIAVTYQVPLNFIFFKTPAITLRENRRVYVQSTNQVTPTTNPSTSSTSASTTSSGTTSSTSSGTTSSTSATSSGTTSSTSATSASSTTSATSASSTSSGTTTSTTSSSSWGTTSTTSTSSGTTTTSSTTSGNNASSGNASSSGDHAHGNCQSAKNC